MCSPTGAAGGKPLRSPPSEDRVCVPYIDYDTAREKATEGEKRVRGQCALADRLDPRRSRHWAPCAVHSV